MNTLEASVGADDQLGLVERGRHWLREGDPRKALECFERAHGEDPSSALVRSYYGLGVAISERHFEQGVELCRSALKQEFFNPELYKNIALVHLSFDFKADAIRYLRRGLMIDPGNRSIQGILEELGCRQRQVLRFLPRTHLLNRWLGLARDRVGRSVDPAHAS